MDSENEFMDSPGNVLASTTYEDSPLSTTNSAANATTTTPLQNLNSLPFNRREMDQWNAEFCAAVEYNPKLITLFEQPPPMDLKDSSDVESIRRMKEYFIARNSRKRQLVESVDQNTKSSGDHIKKQICHIDLSFAQSQELKNEIEQLREEFADLTAKTQMLQRENGALKTRLSKYEATDVIDQQRHQAARSRAKKKDEALEKQRQVLQQVENFLDERPGAVATLRRKFEFKDNVTNSAPTATTTKKTLAAAPATTRPPRYPPSVTTISTSSSSSNGSNTVIYSHARTQGGGGAHRRSQSVAVPIRKRN